MIMSPGPGLNRVINLLAPPCHGWRIKPVNRTAAQARFEACQALRGAEDNQTNKDAETEKVIG